ncbi:phosphatase PAP2 family protein [Ralstonia pseudosolanacearum]|uniref:Phosphatase PAP2 family protein n=1 Tax=Ralstonia pseudosolanacearum TaxID=1310165 RepID=A0A454TM26_9RALS|nr:phosphatase PAP2 family protein [Ralstonia pseudosolanacearum]RNM03187.1 phosphatase PAP2 family protein [Ralstonia pseudosolanacearum]
MTVNELAIPGNLALLRASMDLGALVPSAVLEISFALLDPRLFWLHAAICTWWRYKQRAPLLEPARLRRDIVICFLSFVVSMAAVAAIKVGVNAPRPAVALAGFSARMIAGDPYGFPSGHAAVAVVIAYVLRPLMGAVGRLGLLLLVAWTMLARCIAGLHFPIDVVVGAGIGWAGSFAASRLGGWGIRDKQARS